MGLLTRRGSLTKNEIQEAWRDEDEKGRMMANSTFYDNCKLLSQRYGVHVKTVNGKVTIEPIDESEDRLYRKITSQESTHFQQIDAILLQLEIAETIRLQHKIRFVYTPLDKPAYTMVLHPYHLRFTENRAYLIGFSEHHKAIRIFALDRISELICTPQTFHPDPTFRAEDFFKNSYGAYAGPGLCPENVVLHAQADIAAYLQQRPLHVSQTLRQLSPETFEITLTIAPTVDFLSRLLSFGPKLTVLSPDTLRQQVCRSLQEACEAYGK